MTLTELPALTGSLPRQGRTAGLVSPKIRGCERQAGVPPAHTLEAAFRAGPSGVGGRDAEEDDAADADADADAAPNQVEEALDAWIARNLAALQERAEQGRSAFEQRLAEAGRGLPRSARGRIGVRVRPQRANRATPGAFSIEWVTYRHVHTAAGVVYLSDDIRKGDGDRYPKSAFRGIVRAWQRPLVEEAEVRTRFRTAAKRCRELDLDGDTPQ
nr:conjugative transfer protein MobI(A/C) [Thiocapsa sp.]